jgi:hypothetical protein
MPMTLSGDGTITGLAAGGLPDASITAAELSGAQSGSAPIYAARAWVNFNGTGTVAIRASGNVSSITDNGTGSYTINFATAFSNASYSLVAATGNDNSNAGASALAVQVELSSLALQTTSSVAIFANKQYSPYTASDIAQVNVTIFR